MHLLIKNDTPMSALTKQRDNHVCIDKNKATMSASTNKYNTHVRVENIVAQGAYSAKKTSR